MEGELVDFFLCARFINKARCKAGDYHGQMKVTNFKKWGAKKLTNFPPQPLIVQIILPITFSRLTDHFQLA